MKTSVCLVLLATVAVAHAAPPSGSDVLAKQEEARKLVHVSGDGEPVDREERTRSTRRRRSFAGGESSAVTASGS